MKKIIVYIIMFFCCISINNSYAVDTIEPDCNANTSMAKISRVSLLKHVTCVFVDVRDAFPRYDWVSISPYTTLWYYDSEQKKVELPLKKMSAYIGKDGYKNAIAGTKYSFYNNFMGKFVLEFDSIPFNVSKIYVSENIANGFRWGNIQIIPRRRMKNICKNSDDLSVFIVKTKDSHRGIYEEITKKDKKQKLAIIENDGELLLVNLQRNDAFDWYYGDLKAFLRKTAAGDFYIADWYDEDKVRVPDCYVYFESEMMMKVKVNEDVYEFIKLDIGEELPNQVATLGWSGSGFALRDGYVVTNFHVVEGAEKIQIYGINGDFTKSFIATITSIDKINDIALLKITDKQFKGFGSIPYSFRTKICDVGENIFVLGYPLTTTMGEEIKLTNGIISSRTGYMGDVSLYQISAPVQPGNSGGPVFDNKGNLVGIVCAQHQQAENVTYAIKSSYLKNLVESTSDLTILPSTNTISTLELKDQVKKIRNFVFLVKCSK